MRGWGKRLSTLTLLLGIVACGSPNRQAEPPTATPETPAETNPEPTPGLPLRPTVPGPTVLGTLVLDRTHVFERWQGDERRALYLDLEAGEYISGTATQDGIDVELEILDPEHSVLLWVDTPVGASGVETFHAITAHDGPHVLQIHAFGKGDLHGTVTVHWSVRRTASAQDHVLADAARLTAEAERLRLRLQGQRDLKAQTLEAHRRAADRWAEAQRPSQVGRMLMEMGAIRWRYGADGAEIEAADRLLAEAQPLLAKGDASYRARLHHYRGEVAVAEDRTAEARHHYAAAVDIWPPAQSTNLAVTLNNLGFIEHRLGRPQRAIESYGRALDLWREKGVPSQEAQTCHNLAKVYLWVGDHNRARSLLSHAAEIRQDLNAHTDLAATWTALGQVDAAEESFDEATVWFEKAIEIHRRDGNELLEALTLVDLAVVARRAQRLDEAEQLFRQALPILQRAGVTRETGRVLIALARLHLARGQTREASELAASARELLATGEDPLGLAGAYSLSAETRRASGDAEGAVPSVRRAVEAIERIRLRPTDRFHRASFLSRVISVYETAVEVELDRTDDGTVIRALEWAERSKGRSFLDEFVDGPAPQRTAFEEVSPAGYQDLRGLAEDRILLLYFLGDRRSYLWRLAPTGLRIWTLPPRRELEAGVRRLYDLISKRSRLELAARQKQEASRLSRTLLPDDLLTDLPNVDPKTGTKPHLHIVADGALHYVPFAALLAAVEPGAVEPGSDRRPLIENFEVSYAPSLTILKLLEARHLRRKTAEQELLIVADPVYTVDSRCPALPAPSPKNAYSRLAGSADEASWLVAQVPGAQVLRGFEASAENLRALPLERYRRIHFAVHGELGTSSGARPRLVLAQRDRHCKTAPSFLEMGDVFQWRLGSDLVVLGACKSGLGRDLRGEGLIGMTRALLQAGSSQVVVSLWNVDDTAASRWTPHFYQALAEGASSASALRQAQLRLRDEAGEHDVFYWAPLVLFGAAG